MSSELEIFQPRGRRATRPVFVAAMLLAAFVLPTVSASAASASAERSSGSQRSTAAAASAITPGPRALSAGEGDACALTSLGGAKCWGSNGSAQLGDGTTTNRSVPVGVSGLASGVAAITAAAEHTCAVTTGGGVKCWGSNAFGMLGDGTTTGHATPVDVSGLTSGVAAVASNGLTTCALTTGGGVKCWGYNGYGEIGDGTTTTRLTPVDVSGLTSGVAAIATGGNFTCALTTAGGVKCWGHGRTGELGDGTGVDHVTPVDVSGLTSGVAAIAAGDFHACAVTVAGGLKCWGDNENGQLGDGTTALRLAPVDVVGLTSGVVAAAGGQLHTCALTTAGGVKCWGNNSNGQIGDGSVRTARPTPVDVAGLTSGVAAIATGDWHTCALGTAGAVRCWGRNTAGQLGDGTTVDRATPVDVSGSFFRPECPTLVAHTHTTFTMSDGYAVGSAATFVADPNYVLTGAAILLCVPGPVWSGFAPTAVFNATPVVIPGTGSVVEGNSATVNVHVPVTLSIPAPQTVTVQWTTVSWSGAPVEQAGPADYVATSGTVTFAPGETAQSVTISVNGDTLVEPDEYIVVAFHDPTHATMGGFWGLGFATITNDDHTTISPEVGSVLEGAPGTTTNVHVPVSLSNPSSLTVTAQWTTVPVPGAPGNQADAADYTAASGTVTFAPGETAQSVTISVNGDALVEPDEYVVVAFHDPTHATMGGFWGLGFATITNDDQ